MSRRFQFSLKAMLVAVLVCAAVAGGVSIRLKEKRRERAGIAKLSEKGARVFYDWQIADPTAKAPPGAGFVGQTMGDLFFANVAAVDGNKSNLVDDDLVLLRDFPRLETVHLYRTTISDAGIGHLCALARLKRLSLQRTRISRRGVEELEKALPLCDIRWPNSEEKTSRMPPLLR